MLGAVLSLGAAFFWACSVILFKKSGEVFSPISLNIYKSIVALVLISATMVILQVPFFPDKPGADWWLLVLSGFLGITLADLFFFMALNRLGASLMAVVECLYLPSVIFFSFVLIGETLKPLAVVGGMLILSAVFIGTFGKKKPTGTSSPSPLSGIITGCLSVIFLSSGIVIIKELLETADVFWATNVRVAAGTVSLFIIILFHPRKKKYVEELKFSRAWFVALPASICGNFLALLCWVGGMKYTTASRAAILNQMSTIFIFILAAVFLKEKITVQKSMAIILALTGAFLTIFA